MREEAGPVTSLDRLTSIDVLRGFAVLGILAMNILSIGLPGAARLNPTIAGGFDGFNRLLWWVGYLLFDEKMIALFSMLFGAGLVLQADREADREANLGRSAARLFYRRATILLLIGLAHAYLVWDGDILVTYALCGMLIYPFHRLSPHFLISIALLFMVPAVPFGLLIADVFRSARTAAEKVENLERQGKPVIEQDKELASAWVEIRRSFHPTQEDTIAATKQARAENYFQHIRRKAPEAFSVQTQLFWAAFLWLVGGRMLLGMALMKLGVFSGAQTSWYYLRLSLLGYGVGLPLVWLCGTWLIENDFDPVAIFGGGLLWNSFSGLFVALGHIGMIGFVFKSGRVRWLIDRLAAVGRMALTNYLSQSLICTALFCGWGFGLIGALDRTALYAIIAAVWTAQLWYSPLWLRYFRFGPVEWLWRSLTYGKFQPMWQAAKP